MDGGGDKDSICIAFIIIIIIGTDNNLTKLFAELNKYYIVIRTAIWPNGGNYCRSVITEEIWHFSAISMDHKQNVSEYVVDHHSSSIAANQNKYGHTM